MAEEQAQEKTEEGSQKRYQEAYEKGQVLRSKELVTFAVVFGGAIMLFVTAYLISNTMLEITYVNFNKISTANTDLNLTKILLDSIKNILMTLMPFLLCIFFFVLIANITIGGLGFSAENIKVDFSKLDPIKGLQKIFSLNSLMELFKSVLKFILIFSIFLACAYFSFGKLLLIGNYDLHYGITAAFSVAITTFLTVSASMILIVLIDIPYQIYRFNEQMKMTKQEVKDESKETDGRPEVKSKIRQKQEEFARARMMGDVKTADVVITNPSHYAVALSYKKDAMSAPVVVAKGVEHVAIQIMKVANANKVTVLRTPPLARSLYHFCDIGQVVPEGLFNAVAEVLAYVFALNKYKSGTRRQKPVLKKDLIIPEEYKR